MVRGPVDYPAAFSSSIDTVVAVGDTYPNDRRYERCNVGPELDVMAPGVNINSTVWNYETYCWGYDIKKGSSMAVPHVTGMAALIFKSRMDPFWDSNKTGTWDGREVAYEIKWNCLFIGNGSEYGNGLVNPWEGTQRPDGDVNNDLKVDIVDVAIVSGAYGSYPGHPKWRARADINIDNKVDITDLAITQANYGKFDP